MSEVERTMNRIAGRLLIASPYLTDGHFYRSVIYMVRHDAEGAFGLVLNRPSEHTLAAAFADRIGRQPKRDDPIYLGGPVDGPLMALHTLAGLGEPCGPEVVQEPPQQVPLETAAASVLWITADDDHVLALVDRPDIEARFIARYSGWGPGQLEQELQRGGWLVGPPDWRSVFADPEPLWESIVKTLGRDILSGIVNSPPPSDPQRN